MLGLPDRPLADFVLGDLGGVTFTSFAGRPARPDNALLLRDIGKFHVAKLDTVRAAIERTIALLKERGAAVIAAAATGQLDVMGSAA